jgi:hypothetical protein
MTMQQSSSQKIGTWSVGVFSLLALLSFVWPCYRSFLSIMVNTNEGWNAFFADAAMGEMPLYPSLDRLITNNYPPLSFYFVGSLGRVLGDTILAGRLLSLVAVITIAFFIGKIVRQWGGSLQAAAVGAAYFIATLSLSFRWYVGVNDPQLLAQAIMIVGFYLFLKALQQDAHYWFPLLIMVTAGFFKHNIITLPLSAMIGLVLWGRWRRCSFCALFSLGLILIGLTCCYLSYGNDFFYNLLTPRAWIVAKAADALGDLRSLVIGMLLWLFIAWRERHQRVVQLVSMMMLVALTIGFLQRLGSGVFVNAQFDLIVVISIAVGIGFQLLPEKKRAWWQLVWILPLIVAALFSPNLFSFTQIFSQQGQAAIAEEEQTMKLLIEEVQTSPVDLFCESYITYRANKPFVVDAFNVEERIKAGKLPADALDRLLDGGKLVEVRRRWLVGVE